MNHEEHVFLGFDPGGSARLGFGWSICRGNAGQFEQVCSDLGDIAENVLDAVIRALANNGLNEANVRAAGIDAPLLWDNRGGIWREADLIIQRRGGDPVSPNGLYGSVVYQGPILASLLRQHFFGALQVTEVFPSELRRVLNPLPNELERKPDRNCRGHEECLPEDGECKDTWDARTAAYADWRMYEEDPEWQDLFLINPQYHYHLLDPQLRDPPVRYWMPWRPMA